MQVASQIFPFFEIPNWAVRLVVLLLVIGILLFQRFHPKVSPAVSSSLEKSIAVLPFDNLSRDPDNAYFSDGIQDEILTKLAGIGDLKVISRTSTRIYGRRVTIVT